MANKSLFASSKAGKLVPKADTKNEAGGLAYSMTDEHALAQYICTGTLGGTYYASAKQELDTVLELAQKVSPEFLAKVAVHGRDGHMKDAPALCLAILSVRSPELFRKVFNRVIDSGKMLRNFVQIIRSGVIGRKSLGTAPKAMIRQWIKDRPALKLFRDSVGNEPSLRDILRMVHPVPENAAQRALWGYIVRGPHVNEEALPDFVQVWERFKKDPIGEAPNVPWEMLTGLKLTKEHWIGMASRASWQTTRMNLNTFKRHGVFDDKEALNGIAARLRDPGEIQNSRVFPYQLFMAYLATEDEDIPFEIREALQDAMEVAIENVPAFPGKVWVFPDVSGSMHNPVTGARGSATSAVKCVHVAALITAAVLRRNRSAGAIPFAERVVECPVNPRDSVMTNASKFAACPPGGTDCSAPLKLLNSRQEKGSLLIYVSDNQSWMDNWEHAWMGGAQYKATGTATQWAAFKARNPGAKMVCIDLAPNRTQQVKEGEKDVLEIGGFSDRVFDIIRLFAEDKLGAQHWVSEITKIEI